MFDPMFDYLRENPDVLAIGCGVLFFIGLIVLLFLEWRYGILNDPKPQQINNEENR